MYSTSENMKVFSGSKPKAIISFMLLIPIAIVPFGPSNSSSGLKMYFSSSVI